MTDRFITEEEWQEEFKPGDALEDFPDGTPANRIWTEIESDGFWSVAAGNYLVNRTGRYYVSDKPHDFDIFVEDELIPDNDEEE